MPSNEIGELSLTAQATLLRALQEGEIERVGDIHTRKVDVRVIAATNLDLEKAVKAGRFRADLMYRLNIFPVQVPPLRERTEDIPLLVERFLNKHSVRHGKRVRGVTEPLLATLKAYSWPGNIRELENVIERGVILAPNDGVIGMCELFPYPQGGATEADTEAATLETIVKWLLEGQTTLDELESKVLDTAVEYHQGNLSAAARMLGMTRRQLAYRLKK